MTKPRKTLFVEALLTALLALVAIVVFGAGSASAKYMSDGATQNATTGGWNLPTDFVCIVGVHTDGTLDVADGVTDMRNCVYLQTGTMNGGTPFDLTGMTTSAKCTTAGGTGNDGAAHAWSTSFCSVPLTGLDRTQQMCVAKGGSWITTGKCVAYGAQFKGQDADGTPLAWGTKGTTQAAGTGYCYSVMDMTSAGYTATTCPMKDANTTPNAGYNSSQAYDWSWGPETTRSPKCQANQCCYGKAISGYLPKALAKVDGTTRAAGSFLDLSTFTTMGDCLANGGTWSNWTDQAASTTTTLPGGVQTTPLLATVPVWDYTTQAPDADEGCLHCHSSTVEYNGPAERQKDSYLKTGHKNMLRAVTAGKNWAGPDGVVYSTDTASHAIDFTAGTVGGGPLYFIFGDWMAALPNAVGPNGDTTLYSCGGCHTTGFKDNANPGVQSIGTPLYTPVQPVAPASNFVTAGHKWDLEGIRCSRCHNATVPKVIQPQIDASSFHSTAPTSNGMGALADGTGRNNLCFGCHQSIAKAWPSGASQYDPTLIPTGVSHGAQAGRDFNGHVLGNSFLNSVHAEYAGAQSGNGSISLNSLGKYDLTDPNGITEYASIFKGYTCWQSSSSSSPAKTRIDSTKTTQVDCEVAGGEWKPGNVCVMEIKTQAQCEALYGAGSWRPDDGGSVADTRGTCSTCHDVHNSLFAEEEKELALRKKCDDCHVNNSTTGATDAAAPQVVVSNIRHPHGAGTPFDTTLFESPCVVCHMATQAEENGDQNSMPVHVWRINTNPLYNTFPTTGQFYGGTCSVHSGAVQNAPYQPVVYLSDTSSANCTGATPTAGVWTAVSKDRNAQVEPHDTYTNAVWVDLDLACGQCHGGSFGASETHNGASYKTKQALAILAGDMHSTKTYVQPNLTFSYTTAGLTVNVDASATTCSDGTSTSCSLYTWNWGDGMPDGTGVSTSHTYSSSGAKSITLTVEEYGVSGGTKTKIVTLYTPDTSPVASGTCTLDPNTWIATVTDTSTDDNGINQVTVNWGDGTMLSNDTAAPFGPFTHTYLNAGTYTIAHKAIDTIGQQNIITCSVSPAYFTISGTVFRNDGTTAVPSATVTVKKGATTVKTAYTALNGTFSAGSLKPGTYTLTVTKPGYTFTVPAATITVGPTSIGNTINAVTP